MTRLPLIIASVAILLSLFACREEKKDFFSEKIDPETFPTMMTDNVETLISDSGITRYRITSPLWLVFDEAKVPRWHFPKSLRLEKFDDFMRIDATVECDSATYFRNDELWRLDGNVRIANIAKERFLTNQLFWDQRNHKIYSDSFIHIEKSDRIIEGHGFISDEKLTNYNVRNVSGIFPTSDMQGGAKADSSATQPPAAQPAPQKPSAASVKLPQIQASPVTHSARRKLQVEESAIKKADGNVHNPGTLSVKKAVNSAGRPAKPESKK